MLPDAGGLQRRLRVLMVSNYFLPDNTGGAEIAAYNSAQGLRQSGHEVAVLQVTTRPGLPLRDTRYLLDGLPVHSVNLAHRLPNRFFQTVDPSVAAVIEAEIARFRPDVIHTHNLSGASLAPLWVGARRRIPIVATLHDLWLLCANNMLLQKNGAICPPGLDGCSYRRCFREYDFWAAVPRRRRLFRWLTRHVATFVSPSQQLIDLHVERGYARNRFTLLRHGLRPLAAPTGSLPEDLRRDYLGKQTMLFVGAVVVSKGIEVVLRALPLLIQGIPNFHLIVAGRGVPKYEDELRSYPDHVTMLGQVPRDQIAEVYAGAGLTVMPSIIHENSPLSVCESLMAGTPVLGARIGGIPELIVENETGYVYPPLDPKEMAARAIAHFNRPAAARRDMRRACVAYGVREFSLERHAARLAELYAAAITHDRRHVARHGGS